MNKITLVTSPDDVVIDAFRILCVDLTVDQNQLVSDAITGLEGIADAVIYVWNTGEDLSWLFDKKQKCQLIIFNGVHANGEVIGYLAAQPNSYYFGPLKSLELVNNRDIYDVVSLQETLTINIKRYEQKFK